MTSGPNTSCCPARTGAEIVRAVRAETETKFLRAGAGLMSVCTRFDALEQPIQDIAAFASSEVARELTEAIRRNEAALRDLLASFAQTRPPLERTCREVCRMHVTAARLSGVIRTMTIVALNARVAVAQIGETTGSMSVFSRDAPELVEHAGEQLAHITRALEDLSQRVETAQGQSSGLGQLFADHVTEALEDILSGISRLDDHIAVLTARGGKLAGCASAIREAVTKALMAMQAADALRQGLEHAETTFHAVGDPDLGAELQAAVLVLAGRQVNAAIDRHLPQMQQLDRHLHLANAKTGEFLQQVDDMFRPGRTGVQDLLAAFARIGEVLGEGTRLQQALSAQAQALAASVERVQGILHEIGTIETQIDLIGINAVIACAGLGQEGLPLKVIAQQLRGLAEESGGRVTELTGSLASIRASAQEVSAGLEGQSTAMQNIHDELETQVASGLSELRVALGATRKAIGENHQLLAQELRDGLTAMTEHHGEIRQMVEQLQAAMPAPAPLQPLVLTPDENRVLVGLRATLSIEAERKVHDAWLSMIGQTAQEAPAPAEASGSGMDIVLF